MKTRQPVHDYYQNIAASYDEARFGNSYGAFVQRQEEAFIKKWLSKPPANKVLNMGCGTGRFMEYATDGLDFSENRGCSKLCVTQRRHERNALIINTLRS